MTIFLILLTGLFASLSFQCYRSQQKLWKLWGERQEMEVEIGDARIGWSDGTTKLFEKHKKTTKMIFVSIVLLSILKLGFVALAGMSLARLFLR